MRYLLLALALIACKDESRAAKKRAPKPAAVAEEEARAAAAAIDDPSWISGTWQKKGANEWLLFNPPGQVAVLAGKPATMKQRGKFTLKGRYLMIQIPQPNGSVADHYFDVSPDHSRFAEEGTRASYERGSPPP
jgi:hypothetical protein